MTDIVAHTRTSRKKITGASAFGDFSLAKAPKPFSPLPTPIPRQTPPMTVTVTKYSSIFSAHRDFRLFAPYKSSYLGLLDYLVTFTVSEIYYGYRGT